MTTLPVHLPWAGAPRPAGGAAAERIPRARIVFPALAILYMAATHTYGLSVPTPILVPLGPEAALEDLVDADARVTFDLDGSGLAQRWGWITPQAAWLVFDAEGQGRIMSGLQMFGNVTFWIFWRDGYEALRSLDDNQDGVLRGAELRGLALWQDRNGDGVSDPGEVRPVAAWSITAISCAAETHSSGVSWSPRGAVFANGETRPTYDWIASSRADLGLTSAGPEQPGDREGSRPTVLAPGPDSGLDYDR